MTTPEQPFTLRAAAGLSSITPPLSDTTLLVIDVQAEYETNGLLPLPGQVDAIANIALILETARAQNGHIVHIAHHGKAGGPFDPAKGGRISTAAQPFGNEPIISKALPNAFAGTNLDELIREQGTDHLVIAGFMTHMCVSSTARAALDLGYATTVVSDATATRNLPSATAGSIVDAQNLHDAELAALADRFSIVTATAALLAGQ